MDILTFDDNDNPIVHFHTHGGYYGDGNSHYWSVDQSFNITTGILTTRTRESFYGQLAGNSQHAHKKTDVSAERPADDLAPEIQNKVLALLQPLIDTANKYKHLEHFRLFSRKHFYFVTGRISKAIDLLDGSDHHGYNCLHNIFILPAHNIVITYYSEAQSHSYAKGYGFAVEHLTQ